MAILASGAGGTVNQFLAGDELDGWVFGLATESGLEDVHTLFPLEFCRTGHVLHFFFGV